MARPIKTGLDYFPFDVDFFSDKKIKRLRAKYGNDGIVVYIYVLCMIYGDKGYYTEYDEDLILDISDELNISENSTRQIMKYLLSRSLLHEIHDSTLTEPVTIISAKSIQRRYQEAKRSGKRIVFVKAGYWLLEKAETLGFIKVHPQDNYSGENDDYSGNNSFKSGKNDTKERKVKKSKVNESKVCMPMIPCRDGDFIIDREYSDELTHTYKDMDIILSLQQLRSYMLSNPEKQRNMSNVRGCIEWWLSGDNNAGKYRRKVTGATYDIDMFEITNAVIEEGF